MSASQNESAVPKDCDDAASLRVEIYLKKSDSAFGAILAPYRITPIWRSLPAEAPPSFAVPRPPADALHSAATNHIALVDLELLGARDLAEWLSFFRQRKLGLVMVSDFFDLQHLHLIKAGAHAIVTRQQSGAQIALTVWSAHEQAILQRKSQDRIRELEAKLEHLKVIGQAQAILAAQLTTSESDALSHLQKEARDRRRTVYELACVIVEAEHILGQVSKPPVHERAKRMSGTSAPGDHSLNTSPAWH